jgi:hypothetical protein
MGPNAGWQKASLGAKRLIGRDERPLDKEDLDSGEQILWNPWNGIVAIRVSRRERQQGPNILTRC